MSQFDAARKLASQITQTLCFEDVEMTQKIPEVKAMIDCAKRFIADETNIHDLHGHAQQLKTAAHLFGGNSAIRELAEEWIKMSYRYWNEWGDVEDPLTKEDFKIWLQRQINAF